MKANDAFGADYRALREGTGAYRLPRDVLALEGPDALSYLQGQVSQDLDGLAVGGSTDTLVLAPDGKVDAMARVTRSGDDLFHVDVDGGFGPALMARLARFKLRSKFELRKTDWSCVALRGRVLPASALLRAPLVAPFEWHGWSGLDLLGQAADLEVPASVHWCGDTAYEAARIESGVPAMGRELTDAVIPEEAGVVERTVSFTKGCFTGQELVARIDARRGTVPLRLHGLVFDATFAPDGCDRLLGAPLLTEGKERALGRVTSAAFCPGVGAVAALAYVHRSFPVPGRVQVLVDGIARTEAPWADARPLPLA